MFLSKGIRMALVPVHPAVPFGQIKPGYVVLLEASHSTQSVTKQESPFPLPVCSLFGPDPY